MKNVWNKGSWNKKNEANKKNMNKLDPYFCCVFGTWIMSISMGLILKQGRKNDEQWKQPWNCNNKNGRNVGKFHSHRITIWICKHLGMTVTLLGPFSQPSSSISYIPERSGRLHRTSTEVGGFSAWMDKMLISICWSFGYFFTSSQLDDPQYPKRKGSSPNNHFSGAAC